MKNLPSSKGVLLACLGLLLFGSGCWTNVGDGKKTCTILANDLFEVSGLAGESGRSVLCNSMIVESDDGIIRETLRIGFMSPDLLEFNSFILVKSREGVRYRVFSEEGRLIVANRSSGDVYLCMDFDALYNALKQSAVSEANTL